VTAALNLEPRARAFVEALAASGLPPAYTVTPEEARRRVKALRLPREPRAMLDVSDHLAPAPQGGVPVRVYRPSDDAAAAILYFHGGGWVTGGVEESDLFARELAAETGCVVVSVGYRLAPEAPYPAAIEDADAALDWLAGDLPIVVMGDSAGGNIATVLAARARDRGGPSIAAQVLAYPVTDAGMATESYRHFADGPLLSAKLLGWYWDHYLPDTAARAHPHASPLAGALDGLPPAFVLTAENDPLRDEGEAYATALAAADVPVRALRYDGQIHGFLTLVGQFDGGARAMADIAAFLRETLHLPGAE